MMVDLIVWAPSRQAGEDACAAAFQKVADLNAIFSDYEPDSELSRLCRRAGSGPQPVSPDLHAVLSAARELSQLSDGRYDVTAAPVIRLWRDARRDRALPSPAAITRALEISGYEKLSLTPGHAALAAPNMQLDLGSIAKGYIGDQAVAALRARGCPRAAYIAGGDMVFGDPPPGKTGWPVQPARPGMDVMQLANCAFSVSGDTVQFVEIAGKHYSHVIDARTGQALTDRRMCIVIAPAGLASDPLSTLGTILPEERFRQILHQRAPAAKAWVFAAE
jgi:thiamine biosynthesis lipoprotein